ncbi:MAG: phosphocholine-specific phospholipase C [Solirubrobacteraceae bacterium]
MGSVSRRRFLQLAGSGVATTMLSDSIAQALAIPAHRETRSIRDVEHIVVLTQENRSFDQYFGVMRGVRGFGDPHPVTLPSGRPVWFQADGATVVPPFRPADPGGADNLALTFIEDLDHNWDPTHRMFNGGNWDQWLPNKTTTCMAHMERADLPFHYALADAFTVCDGYHCSVFGPTDPNRYYMWTGWDGNDGKGGGPVIGNEELGYSWRTYPERLQAAGISWKIYQDIGNGLDAAGVWGFTSDPYIGNFGDNSLLYFLNYQNAAPGDPLYDRARTGTDVKAGGGLFDVLAADVASGQLPSVSWIAAPQAYTEHPPFPPGYGAFYTSGVLQALTSNPEVWSKTALFINWDENDGFFDHVVGPYPSVGALAGQSTVPLDNELFGGTAGTPHGTNGVPGPYGLGVRVPLLVVSPWSKGGWVCSEVFDATSLIRFITARFGVDEPNITPWRRAVCGDLTSAFDFEHASERFPRLPSVAAYKPDQSKPSPPDYHPVPPATGSVPTQEPGVRPSRRLGYRFDVDFHADPDMLNLAIRNHGRLGVGLQARSLSVMGTPYSYTIGADDALIAALPNPGTYDLSLHGPNGFFRHFAGSPDTVIEVEVDADHWAGRVRLRLTRDGGRHGRPVVVKIADAYGPHRHARLHATTEITIDSRQSGGWYDIALSTPSDDSFSYQLAGRLESRARLTSDPQIGGQQAHRWPNSGERGR